MGRSALLGYCGLLLLISALSISAAEKKFVRIKKPFAPVYEFLDPTSKIIVQAKKGDHFELVYEGTSWFQVKVKEKVGWIERRAGIVVTSRGVSVFSIPLSTFVLFLLLLVATFGATSFLIYRQRTVEL
ncbi:MAG: hypothetical protein GF344_11025 [Chitinivibrionales bacterium]|nr:hypothetical protein [Chitinivibrionales bacterium]MBD3357336.1 hypothetical protein [Chitinivibrionales bacterium]